MGSVLMPLNPYQPLPGVCGSPGDLTNFLEGFSAPTDMGVTVKFQDLHGS